VAHDADDFDISVVEVAAQEYGSSKDVQKLRSDRVPTHRRPTIDFWPLSIDVRVGVAAPSLAQPLTHHWRGFHSGDRAQPREQRLVKAFGLGIVMYLLLWSQPKD
jgi:hypothetical protein